jgi:hypothetical protein
VQRGAAAANAACGEQLQRNGDAYIADNPPHAFAIAEHANVDHEEQPENSKGMWSDDGYEVDEQRQQRRAAIRAIGIQGHSLFCETAKKTILAELEMNHVNQITSEIY